jgi:hypothetical protein
MKIYITNILPSSLKNKLTKIKYLLINPNGTNKYELVSEDFGVQFIESDNDKVYRIEPNFEPKFQLIKNYDTNSRYIDLLLDNTEYKCCPVVSQLPMNYILTKMTIFEYQTSRKSKLKLVVECLKEPVTIGAYFSPDKHIGEDIVPINFYFVYNNTTNDLDLTDHFFKEEFNMLLSHLN